MCPRVVCDFSGTWGTCGWIPFLMPPMTRTGASVTHTGASVTHTGASVTHTGASVTHILQVPV